MQSRDGKFRGSVTKVAGIAFFLAYAGSLALSVIWMPASIGPTDAVAATAGASSASPRHDDRTDGDDLAILLDWHLNANNAPGHILNALSCSSEPTIAALPTVQTGNHP